MPNKGDHDNLWSYLVLRILVLSKHSTITQRLVKENIRKAASLLELSESDFEIAEPLDSHL